MRHFVCFSETSSYEKWTATIRSNELLFENAIIVPEIIFHCELTPPPPPQPIGSRFPHPILCCKNMQADGLSINHTLCNTAAWSGSWNHLRHFKQIVPRPIDKGSDAGRRNAFLHGFCNQQQPLGWMATALCFSIKSKRMRWLNCGGIGCACIKRPNALIRKKAVKKTLVAGDMWTAAT